MGNRGANHTTERTSRSAARYTYTAAMHPHHTASSSSSTSPTVASRAFHAKMLNTIRLHGDNIDSIKEMLVTALPGWKSIPLSSISVSLLTGGYTNKLFKCQTSAPITSEPRKVLVRIYGKDTETIIDRDLEVEMFEKLSTRGLVERMYALFENGCVYGFCEGRPLNVDDIRQPHFQTLIAREAARWHTTAVPDLPQEPSLFPRMKHWAACAKKYPLSFSVEGREYSFKDLEDEIPKLEAAILAINSPVVLCHNDLLCANIIYNAKNESVQFIDHEYAHYCFRGFDLGNHFDEYAGVDDFDISRYPNDEQQLHFLREYLKHYKKGKPFTEQELLDLQTEVNKLAMTSHIFWGFWGLVQNHISDNKDFDYIAYAKKRFSVYFSRKDEIIYGKSKH